MEDDMLTVEEAAQALGILPGSVRDQIAKGRIVPRRYGGQGKRAGFMLIPRTEVERYRREYRGRRGTKTRKATEPEVGSSE